MTSRDSAIRGQAYEAAWLLIWSGGSFAERIGVFDSEEMLRSIKKTLGSKRFIAG